MLSKLSKLPSINLIKNKTLNLSLKAHFNEQELKDRYSRNKSILYKNKNKIRAINSLDENNNIRKIGLTSLLYRKPKTLYNQSFLNSNKKINNIIRNRHSKIFGKPILKSSSVKLFPTGSPLKRLTVGNIDEIEKFTYYQKIENSKSYQDYLLKERAYIPQESIDNSFVESLSNNVKRDTISNTLNKKIIYNRNSIYNLINNNKMQLLNQNLKIRINSRNILLKNILKIKKIIIL